MSDSEGQHSNRSKGHRGSAKSWWVTALAQPMHSIFPLLKPWTCCSVFPHRAVGTKTKNCEVPWGDLFPAPHPPPPMPAEPNSPWPALNLQPRLPCGIVPLATRWAEASVIQKTLLPGPQSPSRPSPPGLLELLPAALPHLSFPPAPSRSRPHGPAAAAKLPLLRLLGLNAGAGFLSLSYLRSWQRSPVLIIPSEGRCGSAADSGRPTFPPFLLSPRWPPAL